MKKKLGPVKCLGGEAPAETRPERPVIVTPPRVRGRFGNVPDMTPEEHQRRGDAAKAPFRDLVRRVREQ